jgi:hypothetical protein
MEKLKMAAIVLVTAGFVFFVGIIIMTAPKR